LRLHDVYTILSGGTPLCVQSHVVANFLRQHDIQKFASFLEVHWSNRICEGSGILGMKLHCWVSGSHLEGSYCLCLQGSVTL